MLLWNNQLFFLFQSLIGFKINWNVIAEVQAGLRSRFQSLIGFKINWNVLLFVKLAPKSGFNP